jgi:hypothetical protein
MPTDTDVQDKKDRIRDAIALRDAMAEEMYFPLNVSQALMECSDEERAAIRSLLARCRELRYGPATAYCDTCRMVQPLNHVHRF